jgi:hypothetical protein
LVIFDFNKGRGILVVKENALFQAALASANGIKCSRGSLCAGHMTMIQMLDDTVGVVKAK